MKRMARVSTLILMFLLAGNCFSQEPLVKIIIKDPGLEGLEIPVRIDLRPGVLPQNKEFTLYETGQYDATEIAVQVSHGETDQLSWVYKSNGREGSKHEYSLVAKKANAQRNAYMTTSINDSTYIIYKGDQAVLHYRHALLPPPPGKEEKWARSGFIHPLFSPAGEVLTWVQPPDHLHHMGLWNPWTKVTWKGNHTDFWNLGKELGTVRFKNLVGTESGNVFSEFRVVQDHVAFVKTEDQRPNTKEERDEVVVMTEEWIVRVWNITDGYYLDFTSVLTNVTDDTVSLDAYRYGGGLGYRATQKWDNTNSKVLTSEGKTWENGDATRAKWCRVSGDLNGIETGLLFLSDPGNYDFPQPMRIWPMDSNGGKGNQYFEFTPIREKAWILEPGKSYSQRYRIWVQEGGLNAEQAEDAWKAYAFPTETNILYLDKSQ